MPRMHHTGRGGFTLIELLVVILIILLISAVTLPVVLPALNKRQVSEAARIFQAALAGARDAAIRSRQARGIRLLPDPTLTLPTFGNTVVNPKTKTITDPAGSTMLTYNRIISLEIPGDYSEGYVSVKDDELPVVKDPTTGLLKLNPYFPTYYAPYPTDPTTYYPNGYAKNFAVDPNYPLTSPNPYLPAKGKVLRIEEVAFSVAGGVPTPNAPVSWWWNIRVGDKIRIGDSGRYYTIVGPLYVNPLNPMTPGQNSDLFVNNGPPGAKIGVVDGTPYASWPSPLALAVGLSRPSPTFFNPTPSTVAVEFLYVVNGIDDDQDGYIDDGWDGFDNDTNGVVDENTFVAANPGAGIPIGSWGEWETEAPITQTAADQPYVIVRRPVPSQGAREVTLPSGVVIDATSILTPGGGFTENLNSERSRLQGAFDPFSLSVDIMVQPTGQIVPTSIYSSPAAFSEPFMHFWLAAREDVHEVTAPPKGAVNYLPMPKGSSNYTSGPNDLRSDRMLVTLFTRSGNIATTSLEGTFDATSVFSLSLPYLDAQAGVTEAK